MDTKIDLHRFDDEIIKLKEKMEEQSAAQNSILFYGSSTMAHWRKDDKCRKLMEPMPIVNNGFGGATTEELLYYYQSLVFPVKPRVMACYFGANDIDKGYSPEDVIKLTHRLFEWARQDFPGIQFLIIPIKLSPGLRHIHDAGTMCNILFDEYSQSYDDTHILDISKFMYDDAGNLREDIYINDMIHHNEKGYDELGLLIKPAIEKLYNKKK